VGIVIGSVIGGVVLVLVLVGGGVAGYFYWYVPSQQQQQRQGVSASAASSRIGFERLPISINGGNMRDNDDDALPGGQMRFIL